MPTGTEKVIQEFISGGLYALARAATLAMLPVAFYVGRYVSGHWDTTLTVGGLVLIGADVGALWLLFKLSKWADRERRNLDGIHTFIRRLKW